MDDDLDNPYEDGLESRRRSVVEDIPPASFLDRAEELPAAELPTAELSASEELAPPSAERQIEVVEVSQPQGSFMDRLEAAADVAGTVMETGQDIVDGLAESYAQEHDFNKGDRGL